MSAVPSRWQQLVKNYQNVSQSNPAAWGLVAGILEGDPPDRSPHGREPEGYFDTAGKIAQLIGSVPQSSSSTNPRSKSAVKPERHEVHNSVGQQGLVSGTKSLPGGPLWSAPPPSDPDFQAFALRSLGISPEAYTDFMANAAAGTPPVAPLARTPSFSSSAVRAGLFGFGAQTSAVGTVSGVADKSTDGLVCIRTSPRRAAAGTDKSTDKSTGEAGVDLLAQAQADEAAATEVRRQFEEKKRRRAEKAKLSKAEKANVSKPTSKAATRSVSTGKETAHMKIMTVASNVLQTDSANDDFDAEVAKDFEFFRVNDLTFENAVGRCVLKRALW